MLDGELVCPRCSRSSPIEDGVAVLLPRDGADTPPGGGKYVSDAGPGSYLWSHYGDLMDENGASDAYARWASLASEGSGPALDAGCATGRMTLESAASLGFAVGFDLSIPFVRAARDLHRKGRISVRLKTEGRLTREFRVELPARLRRARAEFVVADAAAMPFKPGVFDCAAALNLADKVPEPLALMTELDRVLDDSGARLIFSCPFSWSEEVARPGAWLGGVEEGEFSGRGAEVVSSLLEGCGGYVEPGFTVEDRGPVDWTVRNHANHFERIRSHTLLARR